MVTRTYLTIKLVLPEPYHYCLRHMRTNRAIDAYQDHVLLID